MHPLAEKVGETIRAQNLFPGKGSIIVAVSGGIDSMALLHLLATTGLGLRDRLVVAHFNHQLRGSDSDADAAFVGQAAKRLDLPFETESGDTQQLAAETSEGIEAAARQLRHHFFAGLAEHWIAPIALAHHADDQVETFFLRLLRGAGNRGLSGMLPVSMLGDYDDLILIRPLLEISHTEIVEYVKEERIEFRVDASNTDTRFLRNRIRHELLPLLENRFSPAIRRHVLNAMTLAGDESDFVTSVSNNFEDGADLDFDETPVALQRHWLQRQLILLVVEPTFDLVEALRLEIGRVIEVAPGRRLYRTAGGRVKEAAYAVKPEFSLAKREVSLVGQAGEVEFGGLKIGWERLAGGLAKWRELGQAEGREVFDAESLGQEITLRHWRPGDRIQPIGQTGTAKLQDLFVNQKPPKAERRKLVVAEAADGRLFWVQNLRIADPFKVTEATAELLVFSFR